MSSSVTIVNETSLAQFVVTGTLSLIVSIVLFFAFLLLRRVLPTIFYAVPLLARRNDSFTIPSVFRWVFSLYQTSDDHIIVTLGYDAYVLVRSYTLGVQLFLPIMVMSLALLLPLHVTGDMGKSGLEILNVSHISDGSSVLWVHGMAVYIYSLYAYMCLMSTYRQLSRYYQRYLLMRNPDIPNNAVMMTMLQGLNDGAKGSTMSEVRKEDTSQIAYMFEQPIRNDISSISRLYTPCATFRKTVAERDAAINKLEHALYIWSKFDSETRPTHRTGLWGMRGEKVDSIEYYLKITIDLNNEVEKLRLGPKSWKPTQTAFVLMKTMTSVSSATDVKYLSYVGAGLMGGIVHKAPENRDLHWANASLDRGSRLRRWFFGIILTYCLIALWYIPVSLVQSFISMDTLSNTIPWFENMVDAIPFFRGLLQGFLPLVALRVFMAVLPKICIGIALIEGCRTTSKIDRRSTSILFLFQILNVMLGSIAIDTALMALASDNPTSVFVLLGESLPSTSTFFMNYVIVLTFIGLGVEFINMPMLFKCGILVTLCGKTPTKKEKLMFPDRLETAKPYTEFLLVMSIGFVFSIISPIILPFVVIFFLCGRYVYLNQLMYVYEPDYETGGGAWPMIFTRILVGLFLFQCTSFGLLLHKDMLVLAGLLVPLFITTLVFWRYCQTRYGGPYKHTPRKIAQRIDEHARALALINRPNIQLNLEKKECNESEKDISRDSSHNNPIVNDGYPHVLHANEVYEPLFDRKLRESYEKCHRLRILASASTPPSTKELFPHLGKPTCRVSSVCGWGGADGLSLYNSFDGDEVMVQNANDVSNEKSRKFNQA
eukprot:CFRG3223T1